MNLFNIKHALQCAEARLLTIDAQKLSAVADNGDVIKILQDAQAEVEKSKHTPACLAAREKERAELTKYEKRWPRYCRKCSGEGLVSGRDNAAPHGSGEMWPMDAIESCEHCVGQGICPRCGSDDTNFFEEDEGFENPACHSCGWKEGMSGAPQVEDDCGCFEDSLDTFQRN